MKKIVLLLFWFAAIHASAQYANGKIKVYFNRPVDTALASNYPAVFLNGTWADTLCAYINRAKHTIDVTQYDYSYSSAVSNIATAINSAYSRGVTVRWIYNGSSTNSALSYLNSNIHTLASPTGSAYNIMHDKFVVIDANSSTATDAIVWTGSNDWSQEMVDSDVNNIIVFQDQPLAQAYTAEFNQMWGGTGATPVTANEKFGPYKVDLGPHSFTIGGSTVELYFSPKDSTNNHILNAINSANSQLFFGVYTFTESNDANAIVARKNAGVTTAGVVDQYSTQTGSAYGILNTGLGTALKVYTRSSSIYHNKYLIVDPCNTTSDPLVLTGSHNWTSTADTKNDENTVIIHNADVANLYYQAFYRDFAGLGGTLTPCAVSNPCINAITATTVVNNNVLCYGQSTGKATVHAHGAHGPFVYAWSTSPSQTDSVLNNVAAGTYTVTITDANSCSLTTSVLITQPTALSVSVSAASASCHGSSTGTATANVSGGTGSYLFSWSSTPAQSTSIATGLPAGAYHVTVTDANSCTVTSSVNVTQPSVITISGAVTSVSCLNGNNGSVAAMASGGSGSYQYLWNTTPQQNTATASNLTAGTYTITVTDAHNCTMASSYTVSQPTSGITLSTMVVSASCGGNNGSATVNILTGTGPYTYGWSGGGASPTDGGLAAGSYTVTVSNTSGCSATAVAVVNSTGGPTATTNSNATTCGLSNGTASVTASGGSTPYSFIWSNGGTSASVSNLAAGTYNVTVKDHNNCAYIVSATVASSSALVLNISTSPTSCGLSNGSASVTVSNATNPTYHWTSGNTSANISNLGSGSYEVTVTDANSCSATASVGVGASSPLQLNTSENSTSCGLNNGSASVTVTNATSPIYHWSNSATTSTISNLSGGNYSVTVTDGGNCSASVSVAVGTSTGGTSFNITADKSAICAGDSSHLCAVAGYSTYNWSNSAGGSCIYVHQSGTYTVTASNASGCSATSTPIVIAVYTPTPATYTSSGATLTASAGLAYQWQLNGSLISGATAQVYVAQQTGNYSVEISDSHGCVSTSASSLITVTGINDLNDEGIVKIYPNPMASDKCIVEVGNGCEESSMEIFDITGEIVYESAINHVRSELSIPLMQGVYMVRIQSAKGTILKKVVRL